MALIEAIAVLFGLSCVWLTIRQNIWCWPTGLVQVALYIVIFYQVKLYSDLILHVVYVFLQIYGWHHWLRGGEKRSTLPVTRLTARALGNWACAVVVGAALWGFFMAEYTDASVPYGDAFTTVASLSAQWLLARKRLESWWFWIAVDAVAIGIYFYKDLLLTALLYCVFLCMAAAGFLAWKKSWRGNTTTQHYDEDRLDAGKIRSLS